MQLSSSSVLADHNKCWRWLGQLDSAAATVLQHHFVISAGTALALHHSGRGHSRLKILNATAALQLGNFQACSDTGPSQDIFPPTAVTHFCHPGCHASDLCSSAVCLLQHLPGPARQEEQEVQLCDMQCQAILQVIGFSLSETLATVGWYHAQPPCSVSFCNSCVQPVQHNSKLQPHAHAAPVHIRVLSTW
jgi:hypothetical protein